MYKHHFRLRAEAFSLTPDPSFLYQSPGHAEALAALEIGLRGRRGLLVMTGEVGTGKTTLLYSLLARLGTDVRTAYISNTKLTFDHMLQQALADFGTACASRDRLEQLTALNGFLHTCATQGDTAALVIDEAQNLDVEAFENLRLLSNFETFTSKLLQIVLVGQPELETKLSNPGLRQVAERIAVRCHVNPLGWSESREYIEHRLQCVGGSLDLFTPSALRLVLRRSKGLPRRINIICHNALLFAYGAGARRVSRAHVRAAVREREGHGLVMTDTVHSARRPTRAWFRPWVAAGGAILATLGAVALNWKDVPSWLADSPAPLPRPHQAASQAPSTGVGAPESAQMVAAPPGDAPVAFAAEERETQADQELRRVPDRRPPNAAASEGVEHPIENLSVASGPAGPASPGNAGAEAGPDGQSIESAQPSAVRVVQVAPGATLASLAREVYGVVNSELLTRIQSANPQIVDPNRIIAGDTLRFPEAGTIVRDDTGMNRANHE